MRSLIYDAHLGQPVKDGEAEQFALDLAERNMDFTTATDNIILATRALIYEGKIAPDSVQFCFGELSWQTDKSGRHVEAPRGFCDHQMGWLGRLFKSKKLPIRLVKVLSFDDLLYADRMERGFDKVSYGDAADTLVWPATLIAELEDREENGVDGRYGYLLPLIAELKAIPKGVLVGLGS